MNLTYDTRHNIAYIRFRAARMPITCSAILRIATRSASA